MSRNPFYDALDWAVQGKRVRVHVDGLTYEGWCDIVNHNDMSVVLHSAYREDNSFRDGSVVLRQCDRIEVLAQNKDIEMRQISNLTPYIEHDDDFDTSEDMLRRCYRNRSTGSFPVVTQNDVILNGHKRLETAQSAGLTQHAVEVVNVTDEQARELFELAHEDYCLDNSEPVSFEGLTASYREH